MKLNKKTFLLLMPLVFTMASCGGNKTQGHTHSKETAYSYDENGHYHSCSCDENIRFDYTAHTYTTNSEGINSCSVCGYVENQAQEQVWKVIKSSLEKTANYNGAFTTILNADINVLEGKMKGSQIIAIDPNSGKYLDSMINKVYNPSTLSWMEVETSIEKVEIEGDKYTFYSFDGSAVEAKYADKYYGQYLKGTNPLNTFMEGSFNGGENSFVNILLKMESYSEINKFLPELFTLNTKSGNFITKLEMKDNLYVFNFYTKDVRDNENEGVLIDHNKADYSLYFDKEKLVKAEIFVNMYAENFNGQGQTITYNMAYDFKYSFDEELYNKQTFDAKPTPTEYLEGRANLIFAGGYEWQGPYGNSKINEKVTEKAAERGLELYYDKELKNKVSDDELLTTLPKTYYVKQIVDSKHAYVLLLNETNYKTSSLYKKYIKEYTEKTVYTYLVYEYASTYNITGFPSSKDIENLNAKVTVNGEEVKNSSVSLSLGNTYTIIVSKDAISNPLQ